MGSNSGFKGLIPNMLPLSTEENISCVLTDNLSFFYLLSS